MNRLVLASIVLCACDPSSGGSDPGGDPRSGCTCVALGADYTTGVGTLARLELPSLHVAREIVPMAASGDPVVRVPDGDGRVFVVNRLGADSVTIIDPSTWTVLSQFSTGAGSNPQDLAVHGDRLLIAALGRPEVLAFDLNGRNKPGASIPLPRLAADLDANPDATSILVKDSRAYVVLQHLEQFEPAAAGQVVRIDLLTNTASATDLSAPNPVGLLRARSSAGDLVLPLVPGYSPTMGCLERISPEGPQGCLVQNADLGGWVAAAAPGDDGHVYLAVNSSFTEGKIIRVADGGTIDPRVYSAPTQMPTDLAFCSATRQIVANDANAGGLRVYDVDTHAEVTTQALDIGLPPAYASGIACLNHE